MVDQSELAWRIFSRRHGAHIAYTPMINSKHYSAVKNKGFREANFSILNKEEGNSKIDRPLIVQFCGNDPDQLLKSAKLLEDHCDAVDLNLGCPQDIAKRGNYGAFLQDDWDLIYRIINTLHLNLKIPVTAKFRVFSTVEKTVEYAKMLERAGAQILTCHGRTREQRGVLAGLADWSKIKAVKEAVSVPVFANGNILYFSDVDACLEATGADAVMSAEGNLYNPAIFRPGLLSLANSEENEADSSPNEHESQPEHISDNPSAETSPGLDMGETTKFSSEHLPIADLALEYLEIVKQLKTPTEWSAIKGHLFKVLRPGFVKHTDLRDRLGKIPSPKAKPNMDEPVEPKGGFDQAEGIVQELKERLENDMLEAEKEGKAGIKVDPETGRRIVPHWLSQPYFRPPPPPPPPNKRSKKDIREYLDARKEEKERETQEASDKVAPL
ncbi:hypothetical protein FRC14_006543 [Serendipita sp. 396]|nr:hypothetical protein FRC14_006543 [Serendipita sp. 396]KAG8775080.1 hypothetical protein FRC15_000797 [Serendipita sp. 397]KAG8790796.1 hypothetical protein FRC16_000718 [Serendipita sp. 398]